MPMFPPLAFYPHRLSSGPTTTEPDKEVPFSAPLSTLIGGSLEGRGARLLIFFGSDIANYGRSSRH